MCTLLPLEVTSGHTSLSSPVPGVQPSHVIKTRHQCSECLQVTDVTVFFFDIDEWVSWCDAVKISTLTGCRCARWKEGGCEVKNCKAKRLQSQKELQLEVKKTFLDTKLELKSGGGHWAEVKCLKKRKRRRRWTRKKKRRGKRRKAEWSPCAR